MIKLGNGEGWLSKVERIMKKRGKLIGEKSEVIKKEELKKKKKEIVKRVKKFLGGCERGLWSM